MALFIGGPADGRHIEVEPKREYIHIAVEEPLRFKHGDPPEKVYKQRKTFVYKKEQLACPSKRYDLFVPVDYTCEQVIDSLINGYRKSS